MTLLWERPIAVQGPKTHALIVGVGKYPHAKDGKGVRTSLQGVPDLPSAADSAKLMCDWLIANKDKLAAPLATLEVLISDPGDPNHRYAWHNGPVDAATNANVKIKGREWYKRVVAEPDNVAFLYCCGHGASHVHQPVLFLEDLNESDDLIWPHINLSLLALTLTKTQSIAAAFLFSDACGEFVPEFELGKSQDCRFFAEPVLFGPSRNQVSLLCAAAEGRLAYEGAENIASEVKFGRFTQAVLQGLNGSSARWSRNRWGVNCYDLFGDLKYLRRVFFSHWSEREAFEPYQAVTPTDRTPIVFPDAFELPFVVMTDPAEQMQHYDFIISQNNHPEPPWLKNRGRGDPTAWRTTVPPSRDALYAIAIKGGDHYKLLFQPKEPLFDQWVSVP